VLFCVEVNAILRAGENDFLSIKEARLMLFGHRAEVSRKPQGFVTSAGKLSGKLRKRAKIPDGGRADQ
jgi:hypothetical protein